MPTLCANPEIIALHEAYCRVTGLKLRLFPAFERCWACALKNGVIVSDLTAVISYRQRKIKRGERFPGCLKITNLCSPDGGIIEDFMQELAMIKALRRKPVYSPGKADVLRATGRPSEPSPQVCKQVREILKRL